MPIITRLRYRTSFHEVETIYASVDKNGLAIKDSIVIKKSDIMDEPGVVHRAYGKITVIPYHNVVDWIVEEEKNVK